MSKRRPKHVPFLHGQQVGLTQDDKDMVIHIIGVAADTIREYARTKYGNDIGPGISINITACMLEHEAKNWAARVKPSSFEEGEAEEVSSRALAFRSPCAGRA